jgi:hypothetical protein
MAPKAPKFTVGPATTDRISTWLTNDARLAPSRVAYRLVRCDPSAGDVVVLDHPREGVRAQSFHAAINSDLQGLTGSQSYKLLALGAAGEILASLSHRAKGTSSDDSSAGPTAGAMVGLVKTGYEQVLDFTKSLIGKHEDMASFHVETIKSLHRQNSELRDSLEKIRIQFAVDRVNSFNNDPVREAQGRLWDQLGQLAVQAPKILMFTMKQFGVDMPPALGKAEDKPTGEPAQLPPSEDDDRVVALCVALSALPFDVVAKAISAMAGNSEFFTSLLEGVQEGAREQIRLTLAPFLGG